jgi:hypothetical protein
VDSREKEGEENEGGVSREDGEDVQSGAAARGHGRVESGGTGPLSPGGTTPCVGCELPLRGYVTRSVRRPSALVGIRSRRVGSAWESGVHIEREARRWSHRSIAAMWS